MPGPIVQRLVERDHSSFLMKEASEDLWVVQGLSWNPFFVLRHPPRRVRKPIKSPCSLLQPTQGCLLQNLHQPSGTDYSPEIVQCVPAGACSGSWGVCPGGHRWTSHLQETPGRLSFVLWIVKWTLATRVDTIRHCLSDRLLVEMGHACGGQLHLLWMRRKHPARSSIRHWERSQFLERETVVSWV